MKTVTKRVLTLVLALAMLITAVPVVNARAASSSESLTIYVGESFYYWISGNGIKSVSSSDKKIVSVSKDKDNKRQVNFTAKKAGKATLTIKYKDYYNKVQTYTLKITVKKLSFSAKIVSKAGGYVLIQVDNKTAQTFDKIALKYTFKDADGEVVDQNTEVIYRVPAKAKVYHNLYVGSSKMETLDLEQASFKVTAVEHDPQYIYKDVSSKVKATPKDEKVEGNSLTFSITTKNTTNESVMGTNYVMIYDAQDKLLGVETYTVSLSKKETRTSTNGYISLYNYPDYDHYEIVTQAYYTTKRK